jgi:XTP/dITP diphosphohydrolase
MGPHPVLVIASGNQNKIREIVEMLASVELDVRAQPEGLDVEETGSTYAENARLKAETVAALTGQWTLADDSGLSVDVLEGSLYRSAALITALALADPGATTVLEAEGICRGEILTRPVAVPGYGYNRLLYVREAGCTLAEMPPHQLHKLGSRAKAARQMAPGLRRLLGLGG